ncbi:protein daughter of sevenless isoform X2 [Photinus pyralis]|nr:protein daughter of sevenless isoform X2 [Photinus pyralis]
MFDIKTPTRTYYLAAETEEEMKVWVNCICNICGLKATSDDEAVTRSLNPQSSLYQDHQTMLLDDSTKSCADSPPVSPVSTGPYIPISECITGRLPSQGVQDFYKLLQHNIKNSYFRSSALTKSHSNETYETRSPTYLNDFAEGDPHFYDCPRSHSTQHTLRKTYNPEITRSSTNKLEKNVNSSPLQSPTDSESVFTDDDWTPNTSIENTRSLIPSNSSMTEPLLSDSFSKVTLDDTTKRVDPPPRPPKPTLNNLGRAESSSKPSNETDVNIVEGSVAVSHLNSNIKGISDEMYDFPRSHQIETNENLTNTLLRRHCYNNAAPGNIEGQIFRYDISPKPSTSTTQVFQYDNIDIPDEPASPLSQSSSTAIHSNLPSPLLPSDAQLMPPPQINRRLKPKRKLSDAVSITSSNEPSSPRLAPSVDRSCKPVINTQNSGMRKAFEADSECTRRQRAAPSPTHQDNLYGNQQMCTFLSSIQYLDLDHSNSQYGTTPQKTQPLRSPGATTVYKQVDFMKTQAFNFTRICVEKERKESVSSFKK